MQSALGGVPFNRNRVTVPSHQARQLRAIGNGEIFSVMGVRGIEISILPLVSAVRPLVYVTSLISCCYNRRRNQ